jgi:hypothetical protein
MRSGRDPVSLWFLVALLIAAGLATATVQLKGGAMRDDAFIYFRYVDNFLHGYGYNWNPGEEPVEGYSSFLYLVVLTLPRALGASLPPTATVLSVALFGLTVFFLILLARRRFGHGVRASLLAVSVLAVSESLAFISRSGMESMLFLFLLTVSLDLFLRPAPSPLQAAASGLVFGLAILTRGEALLVYAVWVVLDAHARRARHEPLVDRIQLYRFLAIAAVVVPHLLWRHSYYHDWLPNTYYAKVGPPTLARMGQGVAAARLSIGRYCGAIVAMSIPIGFLAPPSHHRRLLAATLLAWIVYFIRLGFNVFQGHWMFHWLVAPLVLFGLLLLGDSLATLVTERQSQSTSRWRPLCALCLTLGIALAANDGPYRTSSWFAADHALRLCLYGITVTTAAAQLLRRRIDRGAGYALLGCVVFGSMIVSILTTDRAVHSIERGFIAIGNKLREIARPSDTLATGACGRIPYLSGLITYDTFGLNDNHIARRPMREDSVGFGHDKGDGNYVLSRRPTYLALVYELTAAPETGEPRPGEPFELTTAELFKLPEFRSEYEFHAIQIPGQGYFNYWKRKDAR